jgi:ABC-2 type transport system permease protein
VTGYRELLEKEMVEAWRTYRLGVVGALFLVLGITAPVLTRFLPDIIKSFAPAGINVDVPDLGISDVLDQLLKNLIQFGALAAILVTMGSVASEKERGTAAFVLAKPVTRTAFLGAKVVSIGMIFAVATALAVAGAWVYTGLLYFSPPVLPWIKLGVVIWLSTMVYVSITFLGSVLMRSSLGAAGVGFAGLIALSLASVVPILSTWLPAGLVAVAKSVALEESSADVHPIRTVAACALIVGGCLFLAWLRFRNQEL